MEHQNWKPIVFNGPKDKTINEHIRDGETITVKKGNAGGNKQHSQPNSRKLDTEEIVVPKKVDASLAKRIQQARNAQGMTQKQLALAINEDLKTVQTWENGTAIPDGRILVKIRKALNDPLK